MLLGVERSTAQNSKLFVFHSAESSPVSQTSPAVMWRLCRQSACLRLQLSSTCVFTVYFGRTSVNNHGKIHASRFMPLLLRSVPRHRRSNAVIGSRKNWN